MAIGSPRALLWRGLYHWLNNRVGLALKTWEKSLRAAKRLHMPFEVALAHFEIGRHEHKINPAQREHLDQAHKGFETLQATYHLAKAKAVCAAVTNKR